MARFFFDVHDLSGFHRDEWGDEFDSVEEAWRQAQALLPDLLFARIPDKDLCTVACDLRDETGRVLYRGEAVFRITRGPDSRPEKIPLSEYSN